MERAGKQVITRFVKQGNRLIEDPLDTCKFVPVLNGVQK
jgi:hypothetical protein